MSDWTFPPPTPSDLGDHDVPVLGSYLAGRRVALLVTGGIAAMKIPFVARALRKQGASVVAFASKEALRYVTVDALEWSTAGPVVQRLTAAAEHLSDASPFDAYLLAPATYNSINKVAAGVADGVVTSAFASALGRMEAGRAAVLIAPTMHGSMHNRILVASLRRLHALGVRVVPPRDAYGKHNLPDEPVLVAEVARALSRSPLRGRRVVVTGAAAPVPIDAARAIVDRSGGRLAVAIASELHHRGAEVMLVQAEGGSSAPSFVPHRVARTSGEYRSMVREELGRGPSAAVLSTSVVEDRTGQRPGLRADEPPYAPGPGPSGPVPGVSERSGLAEAVEQARFAHPEMHVIALEHREALPEELLTLARSRLDRYPCVVASGERAQGARAPGAWMVARGAEPRPLDGDGAVAAALAAYLEKALAAAPRPSQPRRDEPSVG
jgi:phosphopantothenoylcysteine decarboxylase/phosphopantothenate--cysteine ligase